MTNIIEMAKKAGLELNWFDDNFSVLHGKLINLEQLIRADERELCAKVCEETDIVEYVFGGQTHDDAWNTLMVAAAAIRARGRA